MEKICFDEINFNSAMVNSFLTTLKNKESAQILKKVKSLTLNNISFEGDNEDQSDFIASKFFSGVLMF